MSEAEAFSPAIAAAGSPEAKSSRNVMTETVAATPRATSKRFAM